MGVKKLLLRALLTLLMGTQATEGTISNINEMVETLSTTQMSDAEINGYLQGMGVSIDTANPTYLEAVYAQSQNAVGYFLENNPQVTEAVETVIDMDTGEISYTPITAETIGTTQYVEKGFVGATTNAVFIASLLADWGLSMYGNWQYNNDASFREHYNSMVDTRVDALAQMAQYYRDLYPNDAKKAYECYKSFASGETSRVGASLGNDVYDQYNFRVWLDDEDIEKAWNGDFDDIDMSKYCNPDQISTKTIWRIWEDEAREFWAGGISQFFNKKEVENIAQKLYEEQGVVPRYDLTYDNLETGHTYDYETKMGEIAHTFQQVVNQYNSAKHDKRIPPIPNVMLELLLTSIGISSSDNYMYCHINGQGYDNQSHPLGYTGLSRIDMIAGYLPSNTRFQITDDVISWGGPAAYTRDGYTVSGNFKYSYISIDQDGSISGPTTDTRHMNGIGNWLGVNTWDKVDPTYNNQKLVYTAGGTGFLQDAEEIPPSSLINWAHSTLKFPDLDSLMDYIDKLPKFKLKTVNPKTGDQEEQEWVKVPFIKKIKDKIDEYYDEDDLEDDVDLSDEDDEDLPDYLEDAIIHRSEKDDIEDNYRKPYDSPYEDVKPYEEQVRPSPSDIIIPPRGTTPNTPSTTPTGGGSPIIVPPIVPVGGSSSALFSVYNPTAGEIDSLGSYLWGSSIVELLSKFLQNPIDAIITLHQIYVTPTISGRKNIKLGYLDSGVGADCVSQQYESLDCGNVFVPEYYNDARDYSPWTQVQIYLPFIGIMPLSAEDIIGSTVNVKYGIDVYTGALLATVTVTKPDGTTQTLYTYEGSGCVQYPLTGGNMTGIIRGGLGMLTGGLVGGVSGALVGGLTGALSGGATVSRSSGFGGNSGAMAYKKPYIIITRKIPDDAVNYPHFYGLPANKTTTLISCSGYTRVKDVNLDSVKATEREKKEIDTLLKQGILV